MFDAMFPQETGTALDIRVPPRPPAKGVFSGFGNALSKIVPVSVAETARTLEGFSAVTGFNRQDELNRAELRLQGIELDPFSKSIGRDIKRMTPDAETTGAASEIVFGVGKVITKAAAFGAMGGLPAAVAGTGLVEGTTEAQRLTDAGVDSVTAAKVGAVRGVSTAVGIALPAAGTTLAKTAALVLGGGPASFMAEQQASKMILENADYKKIAEQYDPFDPVGLTVATLIPGIVGGAVHGARARRAKLEAKDPDFKPTPEQEAAARTLQTAEQVTDSALHGKGDVGGAAAHVDALEQARRQLDTGERVDVGTFVRNVEEAEAARIEAEGKPGFMRTADDLVALKQSEHPYLTPDLARLTEIARTPGAFRTPEDRIFMAGMLKEGTAPTTKAVEAAPRIEATVDTAPKEAAVTPAAETRPVDSIEVSARQIAETRPDLQITDEISGQVVTAKQLLDEADFDYQRDTQEARAFNAAVTCFLGRG